MVRAIGLALHRLGDPHHLIEEGRRLFPSCVDAAIPVGGTGVRFLPIAMRLRDLGRTQLLGVAASMREQAAALRSARTGGVRAITQSLILAQSSLDPIFGHAALSP